jgi:hypothetical protein
MKEERNDPLRCDKEVRREEDTIGFELDYPSDI